MRGTDQPLHSPYMQITGGERRRGGVDEFMAKELRLFLEVIFRVLRYADGSAVSYRWRVL